MNFRCVTHAVCGHQLQVLPRLLSASAYGSLCSHPDLHLVLPQCVLWNFIRISTNGFGDTGMKRGYNSIHAKTYVGVEAVWGGTVSFGKSELCLHFQPVFAEHPCQSVRNAYLQ